MSVLVPWAVIGTAGMIAQAQRWIRPQLRRSFCPHCYRIVIVYQPICLCGRRMRWSTRREP